MPARQFRQIIHKRVKNYGKQLRCRHFNNVCINTYGEICCTVVECVLVSDTSECVPFFPIFSAEESISKNKSLNNQGLCTTYTTVA